CHSLYLHSFPTRRSSDLFASTNGSAPRAGARLKRDFWAAASPCCTPASLLGSAGGTGSPGAAVQGSGHLHQAPGVDAAARDRARSEEHTSELQSLRHLVC